MESSLEINFHVNIREQIPGIVVSEPEFEQLSDIDVCDTDLFENEVDASAALIRNSSSSSGSSEKYSFNFNQRSSQPLNHVNDVFPVNLAASLVALVAKHNGSDALLNDLLKRDQAPFWRFCSYAMVSKEPISRSMSAISIEQEIFSKW